MSTKIVKKQKTISYKNKKFVGTLRNGTLTVKVAQTAKGQMLLAGAYDVASATWQEGNRKAAVPKVVRDEFKKAFGFSR